MYKLLYISLLLILLVGCSTSSNISNKQPQLIARSTLLPPTNKLKTYTITWENNEDGFAHKYVTGLEQSYDLVNWSTLITMPYNISNKLSITTSESKMFFRAFNCIK